MKNEKLLELYTNGLLNKKSELILLNRIAENTYNYNETYMKFLEQEEADCQDSTEEYILETSIKLLKQILQSTINFLENMPDPEKTDKEILKMCYYAKDGLDKKKAGMADGTIGAAILSVGKIINLAGFLYEHYRNSPDDREIMSYIEQKGIDRMPDYPQNILVDLFEMLDVYMTPDQNMLERILTALVSARNMAKEHRPQVPNFSLQEGKEFLKIAEYAYTGISATETQIIPLRKDELPVPLQTYSGYRENQGLLNIPGNMKAVFAKKDEQIFIGFAGTEVINKIPTLGADIQQLVSPNLMYLRAVGIVHTFMEQYGTKEIIVTGHSLGGGLAQMAVLANCVPEANISGATFNSAGLSKASLQNAGGLDRIKRASQKITHFRSPYDIVSAAGALVGGVQLLNNTTFPYHCISNIKDSF